MGASRNKKADQYKARYGDIPVDYKERLSYLYDKLNITPEMESDILNIRFNMAQAIEFYDLNIILFEVPEGAPRPRFRNVTRKNIATAAIENPSFIHVYSITGKEDSMYMKRLIDQDLIQLDSLIYTPCIIDICTFSPTPSNYSKKDVILAELGLSRPLSKPDWDNLEKKYSDMFNKNIWIDDTYVIDGSIHKYYSILPRVEIKIRYMNMVFNKYQQANIIQRYGVSPEEAPGYYK